MKVAKFGGSSLSNATQIKKVASIIQADPEIAYVVVSAPGKREESDIKVTDLLIDLFEASQKKQEITPQLDAVLNRFHLIIQELNLKSDLIKHFKSTLVHHIQTLKDPDRLEDALKACGEDFNAQVISQYLQDLGLPARYISPKELGLFVTDQPGNAQLLDTSYQLIAQYRNTDQLLVIPGFFGYSQNDNIVTFPRGGSDITGAIVARGVQADVYENFTDQSYIFAAHPGIISNPYAIKEITYQEMRELAYSGFGIFHDEALEPLYKVNIPVTVRNTNQPSIPGTKIVSRRQLKENLPVIGISCDEGFTAISIRKYLLNRQLGFTRKLLQIFEDHGVSIEHIPTGIDDISIVIRTHYLEGKLDSIVNQIEYELQPDTLTVEDDLAIIVVVGEGMVSAHGMASKATTTLAQKGISIRMINQGASEISMFFTIEMKDKVAAIHAMYHTFFADRSK